MRRQQWRRFPCHLQHEPTHIVAILPGRDVWIRVTLRGSRFCDNNRQVALFGAHSPASREDAHANLDREMPMKHHRTITFTLTALVGVVLAAGCSRGTPTSASVPDRAAYDGGVGMIGGGRIAGMGMIGGGRSGELDSGFDSTSTVTRGSK